MIAAFTLNPALSFSAAITDLTETPTSSASRSCENPKIRRHSRIFAPSLSAGIASPPKYCRYFADCMDFLWRSKPVPPYECQSHNWTLRERHSREHRTCHWIPHFGCDCWNNFFGDVAR